MDSMKIPTIFNNGTCFYTTGSHKESALFLDKNLAIVSGLIFINNEGYAASISNTVQRCPIVELDKCDKLKELSKLDFRVIRKSGNNLEEQSARACILVHLENVKNCFNDFFDDLHVRIDGNSQPVKKLSSLFASILLLSINSSVTPTWEYIKSTFDRWKAVSSEPAKLLDQVAAVSTPFGNESFFNTVNVGHVSNVFGDKDCLLLLDIQFSFGSQGGAIYDRNMKVKGLIVGTTFMHRKENVYFPLAINIHEIMRVTLNRRNLCLSQDIPFSTKALRSVCMIDSQGCWGTGCAFELKDETYIISCSHVISTDNISCTFNDRILTNPKLIYKNPIFDSAYDIALMEACFEKAYDSNWFCKLANYIPRVGQRLFAVGFPVFKSLAVGSTFKPSVVSGRVTKYSEGILFTDCSVQYGQSGGPIFDENGQLIAIAVSNFKCYLDDQVYPFHNMCVPIKDVYDILLQYSATKDATSLKKLEANWNVKSKWKLKPPMILNKL